MAYVVSGNLLTMYINGVPDSSMVLSGPVVYNDRDMTIGCDAGFDASNAALKNFRWYNFALSLDQVAQDMQCENVITAETGKNSAFIADFANILKDPTGSDVKLVVENTVIPAHKVILKNRSEYFALLLSSGMKESESSEIQIDGPLSLFQIVLHYIYTGDVKLEKQSPEFVFTIYQEFNKYLLHDAEAACNKYLMSHIAQDPEFAFQLLVPSCNAGHSKIKQQCMTTIGNHLTKIVTSGKLFTLNSELQQEVLTFLAKSGMLPNKK